MSVDANAPSILPPPPASKLQSFDSFCKNPHSSEITQKPTKNRQMKDVANVPLAPAEIRDQGQPWEERRPVDPPNVPLDPPNAPSAKMDCLGLRFRSDKSGTRFADTWQATRIVRNPGVSTPAEPPVAPAMRSPRRIRSLPPGGRFPPPGSAARGRIICRPNPFRPPGSMISARSRPPRPEPSAGRIDARRTGFSLATSRIPQPRSRCSPPG
jgi:hypothetical protein